MFSWGANSAGQLGQGVVTDECVTPKQLTIANLKPEQIIDFKGGSSFSLLLDNRGLVFFSGQLNYCNLESSHFKQIEINRKIKQIACGWDFAALLSEQHELFVFGSNKFGQLGLPLSIKSISIPYKIRDNVYNVACGLRYLTFVSNDDILIIFGTTGGNIKKTQPICTLPNFPIKMMACGQKHMIIVNKNDEIYVWGNNKWGQLGLDPTFIVTVDNPQKLNINVEPYKLFCGWTHNAILTMDNELLMWGRNDYGQLGHQDSNCWQPKIIQLKNVKCFSAGSEHNLAVTNDNKLFTWGWNEHGSCGNGTTENVYQPICIKSNSSEQIRLIGTGTGQSFAVIT